MLVLEHCTTPPRQRACDRSSWECPANHAVGVVHVLQTGGDARRPSCWLATGGFPDPPFSLCKRAWSKGWRG